MIDVFLFVRCKEVEILINIIILLVVSGGSCYKKSYNLFLF